MDGYFTKLMKKVVRWLDPRLEKYRGARRRRSETESRAVAAKMGGAVLTPASGVKSSDDSENIGVDAAKSVLNEGKTEHNKPNVVNSNKTNSKKKQVYDADFEPVEEFPRPPHTEAELVLMLRQTPVNVLSEPERQRIAAAMGFRTDKIEKLVLPKSQVTFVRDTDMMGPLMLDQLYKSGFSHFPVLDKHGQVVGILHTSALNALEVKDSTIAAELMDEMVYYLREDYTVEMALAAVLRTGCFYFLVVNRNGNLRGILTFEILVEYLFGEVREDGFEFDGRLIEVIRRRF